MSDLAASWKAAKLKFETDTGMKKPTETGKVGFGKLAVSYRKSTDIESSLEALDKLIPDQLNTLIGEKAENKIAQELKDLQKSANAYGDLLTKTIKEQKDSFGKGADSMYRDLKILRASLENIVAKGEKSLALLSAARDTAESGITTTKATTVNDLKALKQVLTSAVKNATVRAQNILKDPTPASFNGQFRGGTAARDVTQALLQIAKFTLPDDINPHSKNRRDEAMLDKGVYEAVRDLYSKVEKVKDRVKPFVNETGNSALDANITKMANHPILLPDTASKEDVIAATKNFIKQLKVAQDIAAGFSW